METDCIRSAASINAEEAHYAGIQEELDAEASELRLSVIEHLDRQQVDAGRESESAWRLFQYAVKCELGDRDYRLCLKRAYSVAEQRMLDLWDALEIVRNIEARA